MFGIKRPFDPASFTVVALTFMLFVVALFVKGLTHDIILEAAVLLVSVKLIMMSCKLAQIAEGTEKKLDDIQGMLRAPDH
jgi:hypothetical protein